MQGYECRAILPALNTHHFPFLPPSPPFHLPSSLHLLFPPGSGTDCTGFSAPSLKKAPLLVMQSGRSSTGIWHISSDVCFGEEECGILYAGRISLIEVSA